MLLGRTGAKQVQNRMPTAIFTHSALVLPPIVLSCSAADFRARTELSSSEAPVATAALVFGRLQASCLGSGAGQARVAAGSGSPAEPKRIALMSTAVRAPPCCRVRSEPVVSASSDCGPTGA